MQKYILIITLLMCVLIHITDIKQAKAEDNYGIPEYSILKTEDITVENKIRARIHVLAPNSENQSDLESVVNKLVSVAIKANPDLDAISFIFYATPDKNWQLGTGVWAPKGEFSALTDDIARRNVRDDYKIIVTINKSAVDAVTARNNDETKFGLTEQERRQINWDLALAENRASFESDTKYLAPLDCYSGDGFHKKSKENMAKYISLEEKLSEEYKNQVIQKYGISKETEKSISSEAMIEQWPLPELKKAESDC